MSTPEESTVSTVSKPLNQKSKPKTQVMVDNALKSLNDRTGSSLIAIKKFIVTTYNVDAEKISRSIKKYVIESVQNGKFIQTKGSGLAGSFRMSAAAKKGPKSKVKKPKKSKENGESKSKTKKSALGDKLQIKTKIPKQMTSSETASTSEKKSAPTKRAPKSEIKLSATKKFTSFDISEKTGKKKAATKKEGVAVKTNTKSNQKKPSAKKRVKDINDNEMLTKGRSPNKKPKQSTASAASKVRTQTKTKVNAVKQPKSANENAKTKNIRVKDVKELLENLENKKALDGLQDSDGNFESEQEETVHANLEHIKNQVISEGLEDDEQSDEDHDGSDENSYSEEETKKPISAKEKALAIVKPLISQVIKQSSEDNEEDGSNESNESQEEIEEPITKTKGKAASAKAIKKRKSIATLANQAKPSKFSKR